MKHFSLPKDGGLIEEGLPKDILHSREKIYTEIYDTPFNASKIAAEQIIKAINEFTASNPDGIFKLGLTTGSSPVSLYKRLCKACKEGRVSFKNVRVNSIDEFYPVNTSLKHSRNHILRSELLDHIDILPENILLPKASISTEEVSNYCAKVDAKLSDLDLLVIGVGEQGQVGFNEAGSTNYTRTRLVHLPYKSRKRQARYLGIDLSCAPSMAITMGIQTMLSAKKVILMAWGENKSDVVRRIVEGEIGPDCPASYFQLHSNVSLYVDENSGANLTRVVAPWCIGPCEWTNKFKRKAVVWLCQQVKKPILKLSYQDYLQNNLGGLLEACGSFDKINIQVFNDLQHTITGWPGGKPNADDSTRPVPSLPNPKTVLIFSPHPDDDVISMGGTFIRLAHQGHNVHVAYETSGNVAVHDDVVLQHMDAARELGFSDRFDEVKELIKSKVPGEAEPRKLLELKGAIRRSEAKGAVRSFGLDDQNNAHFLNLPFYESGGIQKLPRTQADVDIIKDLMRKLQPDMIFMAGDLADPHGTHRVCTEAALEALEQLKEEAKSGSSWLDNTHVWLYRGAWMEWDLGSVDMAVPLSPDEVVEKRHAIYRHLSQKDIVPFPGEDPREFWQRAEERTQNTARQYDELGMAEYQAMEVFLKLW